MIHLDGASLTIEQLLAVADDGAPVALDDAARARVQASRRVVVERARSAEPAYGINTGFGSFADVTIAPEALEALQLNLLRSHAAGVGDPLPVRAVRATMVLRANVLAKGFSGISVGTLEALLALVNAGVHPRVPSRGSVGASGDLAPLAHLALVLIGEGEVLDDRSPERLARSGRDALALAGLTPITLGPKEGLALINGTQPSTAVLALALADAEVLARAADIAAALSIDALRGSIHPFEARIHEARPFAGQRTSAANIEALMRGSGINKSHEFCGKVQDAYSMRCAAQVHGATREALRFVRDTVAVEANSATDNPMVFADTGDIVFGGDRAAGDDQRAAHRSAGQPGAERTAGVPDPRGRRQLRLHDGAGDRRGGRLRAQVAGASRRRRHHPDLGEQGRPRQHEHDRRAQGGVRRRTGPRGDRDRSAVRLPGDRLPRAARDVAGARRGARARAIARRRARRRPRAVAGHREDHGIDRVARA